MAYFTTTIQVEDYSSVTPTVISTEVITPPSAAVTSDAIRESRQSSDLISTTRRVQNAIKESLTEFQEPDAEECTCNPERETSNTMPLSRLGSIKSPRTSTQSITQPQTRHGIRSSIINLFRYGSFKQTTNPNLETKYKHISAPLQIPPRPPRPEPSQCPGPCPIHTVSRSFSVQQSRPSTHPSTLTHIPEELTSSQSANKKYRYLTSSGYPSSLVCTNLSRYPPHHSIQMASRTPSPNSASNPPSSSPSTPNNNKTSKHLAEINGIGDQFLDAREAEYAISTSPSSIYTDMSPPHTPPPHPRTEYFDTPSLVPAPLVSRGNLHGMLSRGTSTNTNRDMDREELSLSVSEIIGPLRNYRSVTTLYAGSIAGKNRSGGREESRMFVEQDGRQWL